MLLLQFMFPRFLFLFVCFVVVLIVIDRPRPFLLFSHKTYTVIFHNILEFILYPFHNEELLLYSLYYLLFSLV